MRDEKVLSPDGFVGAKQSSGEHDVLVMLQAAAY